MTLAIVPMFKFFSELTPNVRLSLLGYLVAKCVHFAIITNKPFFTDFTVVQPGDTNGFCHVINCHMSTEDLLSVYTSN